MTKEFTEKELLKKSADQLKSILDLDFGYSLGAKEHSTDDLIKIILELQIADKDKENRKFDFLSHLKEYVPLNEEMITNAFYTSRVSFHEKYLKDLDVSDERKKDIFYEIRDIVISNQLGVVRPGEHKKQVTTKSGKEIKETSTKNPHYKDNSRFKERSNQLVQLGYVENEDGSFSSDKYKEEILLASVTDLTNKDWDLLINNITTNSIEKTPQLMPTSPPKKEEIDINKEMDKIDSEQEVSQLGNYQEAEQEKEKIESSTTIDISTLKKKGDKVNHIIDLLIEEGKDLQSEIKSKLVMDRYSEIFEDSVSDGYAYDKIALRKKAEKADK